MSKKKIDNYSILMPPPNVSGSLHIGHALGSFLQDTICRFASLLVGKNNVHLLPGLDHGGISTEYSALKNIKDKKTSEEQYSIIYNFTNEAKKNILNQMKKFSLNVELDKLKYTMDPEHLILVNKSFVELYNKGLIYEDERIIYWDNHFKSSLSNLEVLHKNIQECLYYIKYKIVDEAVDGDNYLTIATTRPETMFGDVVIAVCEKYKYLVGKKVLIPIENREIPIIFDKSVLEDFGTGCLKVTPGHDEIDFNLGKKHKLSIINILDENLKMNQNVPENYRNLTIQEARGKILQELTKLGLLEKEEKINHSIKFGEKSGEKIETIVKKQWYLDLSKSGKKSLELLEKGDWNIYPNYWINTYKHWINNLEPWCISREIIWGHKIPVWRTNNGEVIVAQSEEEAKIKAKNQDMKRDPFVLDTWFSSALWPMAYENYPTTLLVTGHDILFFWVARMVMMSLELRNQLPFESVLLHDLVRDGQGEKMSKTRGNVQDPLELIDEYGSDIIRHSLLSKISLRGKIRFSITDIIQSRNLKTKLENVVKFLEKNYSLEDFLQNIEIVETTITNPFLQYFLNKLKVLSIDNLFKNYNIDSYLEKLYTYFWGEYCDWLIEISKKQIKDNEIKFTLIYILRELLCLWYGFFPEFTESTFKKLFKKEIYLQKTEIKFYIKEEINVEDFFFVIKQIRSLEAQGIRTLFTSMGYSNEELILESLKLKTIDIKKQDISSFIKIIIRQKEIYIKKDDNIFIYLNKMIYKKQEELVKLEKKLQQSLPSDILNKFEKEISFLKEEIEIISNI